jgi:hypothetical protein
MFVDLSVPIPGDGPAADVAGAPTGCAGGAAKLSIASEMPERQRKTPSRLRALIKPNSEGEVLFMVFPLSLFSSGACKVL